MLFLCRHCVSSLAQHMIAGGQFADNPCVQDATFPAKKFIMQDASTGVLAHLCRCVLLILLCPVRRRQAAGRLRKARHL